MTPDNQQPLQQIWKERIQDWQSSGLSQAQWCQQHDFSPHQLSYWKLKLYPQPKRPRQKLIPIPLSNKVSSPMEGLITIHFPSGIRIEASIEQATLLIKALSS